jgi:uncharacterized protein YbcC (UPF0753/DUF2309 family)
MQSAVNIQSLVEEAVGPVSQFWPMKGFVSHNPIQGLEHLQFDEAFRQAKNLFGAEGYLSLDEYRALFRAGRIDNASVQSALARVGPRIDESLSLSLHTVTVNQIHRLHLLHGITALEPALLDWQLTSGGALQNPVNGSTSSIDLNALWNQILSILGLDRDMADVRDSARNENVQFTMDLPFRRTLSDWLDQLTPCALVTTIDQQMIKWVSSFADEGMAAWSMPGRKSGFYTAWRELAQYDASGRLLGIADFAGMVAALPDDPEVAIQQSLHAMHIPQARWPEYLTRVFAQLPGWAGLIRWRGLNPDDPIQKQSPIDPLQYLAVRLFYEQSLVGVHARRSWGTEGNLTAIAAYLKDHNKAPEAAVSAHKIAVSRDAWRLFQLLQLLEMDAEAVSRITREQASRLLRWLDDFPAEKQLPVWLEAYEESFRIDLLSRIRAHRGNVAELTGRPLAQAAFCIDVRSEPFRRHFEQVAAVETFGYAGFFGIPISHRGYDTEESFPLCPVLLTPSTALFELPRDGQQKVLARYAAGSRWKQFGEHLFHELKHSPIASFLLVDILGLFFSLALLGKTMLRRPYHGLLGAAQRWFVEPVSTEIDAGAENSELPQVSGEPVALTRGFTIEQQANFIEGGLRMIGLTRNFGRFVVLCGHGSTTDNNPYFAALDCGACGGRHGDPNARTFAAMGNNPEVRAELASRGLTVPDDTWFLPAKHNTTADRVDFYDTVDIPASHRDAFQQLQQAFLEGGEQQALDRCNRIPGTPRNMTAKQAYAHVESRSFDWANTRPEWGLSGNAGFIIGRRALTRGLDLGGRCFLHSYDAKSDPEGAFLEKIMTAPLVVGEWINMQYYTSATDPWKYGSGSKVIHNVVGGLGVMYGSQSDLATGLPLQTVNDGATHFHEPMRLLTIIEADPAIIGGIIARHDILQQFFHNGWLNLVAIDPASSEFHRYNQDATWQLIKL